MAQSCQAMGSRLFGREQKCKASTPGRKCVLAPRRGSVEVVFGSWFEGCCSGACLTWLWRGSLQGRIRPQHFRLVHCYKPFIQCDGLFCTPIPLPNILQKQPFVGSRVDWTGDFRATCIESLSDPQSLASLTTGQARPAKGLEA